MHSALLADRCCLLFLSVAWSGECDCLGVLYVGVRESRRGWDSFCGHVLYQLLLLGDPQCFTLGSKRSALAQVAKLYTEAKQNNRHTPFPASRAETGKCSPGCLTSYTVKHTSGETDRNPRCLQLWLSNLSNLRSDV